MSALSILLGAAVGAADHVVSGYAQVLAPVTGSLATVAAIIAVTLSVRLLLLPLSLSAARGQASQARLQPQVAELRKRHARHPELLRAELAALYQRENTSALAGCLPALLQLPFFSVMYRLFLDRTVNGKPNGLLSHELLGAPLGGHWLSGPGPLSAQGAVFIVLLGLVALVAWISARTTRRAAGLSAGAASPGTPSRSVRLAQLVRQARSVKPAKSAKSAQSGGTAPAAQSVWAARRSGQTAQPAAAAQPVAVPAWLTGVLPYTTIVVAAVVPLAAGIYLLTTTAWTTAERALLRRRIQPPGGPAHGQAEPALA